MGRWARLCGRPRKLRIHHQAFHAVAFSSLGHQDQGVLGLRGELLVGDVIARVFDEGPGQPAAHHLGLDIQLSDKAPRDRSVVAIERYGLADNFFSSDHRLKGLVRLRPTGERPSSGCVTSLSRLRRIDPIEPDHGRADMDSVAVGDDWPTSDGFDC